MPKPFRTLTSRVVCLAVDDIDTDQIVPARFLKTTSRQSLGDALFADWRYDAEGRPRPGFPLDAAEGQGARVLLAGANFGCGSSREHAAWALVDYGFRAVLAPRFADIFRDNALENGLLPVELSLAAWSRLLAELEQEPGQRVRIDLARQAVEVLAPQPWRERFSIDAFARHRLLRGLDSLDYLLSRRHEIARFEAGRAALVDTRTGPGANALAHVWRMGAGDRRDENRPAPRIVEPSAGRCP